jgi:thiol:disulfide interchange protein DsbC
MGACAARGWLWIGLLCALLAHRALAGEAEVRRAVETVRPGATIESIAPAALNGLYEVFVDGDIVYVDEAGKTTLVGTLLDVAGKRNLTQERRDKLLVVNFAELPLELAVKTLLPMAALDKRLGAPAGKTDERKLAATAP